MENKILTLALAVVVIGIGASAISKEQFGALCNPRTEYVTKYYARQIPVRRIVYRDHFVPTTVYQPLFSTMYSTLYRTEYVPQYITTTSYLSHFNTQPDIYQPMPFPQTNYIPQFRTQAAIQTNQTSEASFRTPDKSVETIVASNLPEPREATTESDADVVTVGGVIAI